MNSLEYIKKTIELISLGDNINIKARLIHLKRHIEEDYEKHEKDMNSFAEWCRIEGFFYDVDNKIWCNYYTEPITEKTTAQLREMWEIETGRKEATKQDLMTILIQTGFNIERMFRDKAIKKEAYIVLKHRNDLAIAELKGR